MVLFLMCAAAPAISAQESLSDIKAAAVAVADGNASNAQKAIVVKNSTIVNYLAMNVNNKSMGDEYKISKDVYIKAQKHIDATINEISVRTANENGFNLASQQKSENKYAIAR